MKRLLPFVFMLVSVYAAILHVAKPMQHQNSAGSTAAEYNLLPGDQSLMKPNMVSEFARQVSTPIAPIEETSHISWWWWIIGVILILGGGMLLYVLMKKNPRKDA